MELLIGILIGLSLVIAIFIPKFSKRKNVVPVNYFLTDSVIKKQDRGIYQKLKQKLQPDEELFYSIRAIDVIRTNDNKAFARLTNKRIDFIITDKNGKPKYILVSDKLLYDILSKTASCKVRLRNY